jgi:regulator of protease activity HflC (stomatin/prohibitin superfamily)
LENALLYVILGFLVLAVVVLLSAFKIVSQTDNLLIERLGKYHRSLAAGVHIIVPFIDRVAHRESILERQLPAKKVPAFTKDNVQIEITLAILYRVTDASKAWYRIKNIDQAIETIIIGIVRSTIGASDLDQVQSNRSQLSTAIAIDIQHVTDEWGIHVTRVEIVDVEVDEATRTAMQRQLNAERNRRAIVTEAEGKRQAANLEADAGLYTAQQKAQAQRVLADAQAYAVQTVAQAINNNGESAINFDIKKIQADAISSLASQPGSKIVLLPADILETLTSVTTRLVSR